MSFCVLHFQPKQSFYQDKYFPDSEVTLTIILSLITFVPPVTALLSPPLSRITGADSPVIADSSTLAIPSITSPSEGNYISGFTNYQDHPIFNLAADTSSSFSRLINSCYSISLWFFEDFPPELYLFLRQLLLQNLQTTL